MRLESSRSLADRRRLSGGVVVGGTAAEEEAEETAQEQQEVPEDWPLEEAPSRGGPKAQRQSKARRAGPQA